MSQVTSFYPPYVGFNLSGVAGIPQTPSLYLGKNGDVTWEAVGFDSDGRPGYMSDLFINLTRINGSTATRIAQFAFSATGIQAIITADSNAGAAAKTFTIRQVDVCDAGVAKKMMILASATYT